MAKSGFSFVQSNPTSHSGVSSFLLPTNGEAVAEPPNLSIFLHPNNRRYNNTTSKTSTFLHQDGRYDFTTQPRTFPSVQPLAQVATSSGLKHVEYRHNLMNSPSPVDSVMDTGPPHTTTAAIAPAVDKPKKFLPPHLRPKKVPSQVVPSAKPPPPSAGNAEAAGADAPTVSSASSLLPRACAASPNAQASSAASLEARSPVHSPVLEGAHSQAPAPAPAPLRPRIPPASHDNNSGFHTWVKAHTHASKPTTTKSASSKGNVAPRGYRSRGGKPSNRDARWPKNREIPKGGGDRWATDWNCPDIYRPNQWASNSDDSVCDDGRPRADADEDTLTGWDGSWAPAPLDWDSRPIFRSGQSVAMIDKWLLDAENANGGASTRIHHKYLPTAQCDIALRLWIPESIDTMAPQTFWEKLVRTEKPRTVDDGDLTGALPWWETYESSSSSLLRVNSQPTIAGPDPRESRNERIKRENDNGSANHAQNRVQAERAKRAAEADMRKKIKVKEHRIIAATEAMAKETPTYPKIKPGIKLYVRSATPDDMEAICAIHNWYIEHTTCSVDSKPLSVQEMTEKYRKIQSKKLPFIVACERGEIVKAGKSKHRRIEEDIVHPDHVVGFIFADCFSDIHDTFRYSVKVEFFTARQSYLKGVATCMMDKLMATLDPNHIERGGYDTEDEKLECAEPERVVKTIIISIPYDEQEPQRKAWISRWLTETLEFDVVGDFPDMGVKHEKRISINVVQRFTGVTIDPATPPKLFLNMS